MDRFCFSEVPMEMTAYDAEGRRKYLNSRENERFLRASQQLPEDQAAFCLTIYFTGCRITEALNLTGADIETDSGVIVIRSLKKRHRSHIRRLPIPADLAEALRVLNGEHPDQRLWDYSRTTAWRIIKEVMKNAKISGPQATAKGLRHAFGVRGAMNQIPLTVIQKWMGHSALKTTAIYLDVQEEEQRKLIARTWENP